MSTLNVEKFWQSLICSSFLEIKVSHFKLQKYFQRDRSQRWVVIRSKPILSSNLGSQPKSLRDGNILFIGLTKIKILLKSFKSRLCLFFASYLIGSSKGNNVSSLYYIFLNALAPKFFEWAGSHNKDWKSQETNPGPACKEPTALTTWPPLLRNKTALSKALLLSVQCKGEGRKESSLYASRPMSGSTLILWPG